MTARIRNARAHRASGRFLFTVVMATVVMGGACQLGGFGSAGRAAGPPPVVLERGPISVGQQMEAAELLERAEGSFRARRFFETLRLTADLLGRLPASNASGDALRLRALAELELGAVERAEAAAGRYLELLPPGDIRAAEMRLLQARALDGDPAAQLDRLLRIPPGAPAAEVEEAESLVRAAVDSLSFEELDAVAAGVSSVGPMSPLVLARLAVEYLDAGQEESAAAYARAAMSAGATDPELAIVEGVLRGELPEERQRVRVFTIATVLPKTGPPALVEYAGQVAEGIEVAMATVLGEEYEVTVLSVDNEGDPERSAQLVAELEADGVAGLIGFLQDDVLIAAGGVRQGLVPLVSPTARTASIAGENAYSLAGADPEAAVAIARYAAGRAFQRVAMVYPATPVATEEADAFADAAAALGIPVVGRFTYEAGATFFESQILEARDSLRAFEIESLGLGEEDTLFVDMLEPVGLFMPIPPEDVELLAPQVIHFGLDTLAIEVIGTSGWSDAQALQAVDTRHTTGVVATAPAREAGALGALRFQQAYEERFQRTLIGGTPSIGYDAALLLLEALRPGRIRPEQSQRSFRALTDIQGATGTLSVVNDRVVRRTRVVRIDNGVPVPVEGR